MSLLVLCLHDLTIGLRDNVWAVRVHGPAEAGPDGLIGVDIAIEAMQILTGLALVDAAVLTDETSIPDGWITSVAVLDFPALGVRFAHLDEDVLPIVQVDRMFRVRGKPGELNGSELLPAGESCFAVAVAYLRRRIVNSLQLSRHLSRQHARACEALIHSPLADLGLDQLSLDVLSRGQPHPMLFEVLEHALEDRGPRVDHGSVCCVDSCRQLAGEHVSEYRAFDAVQRLQFCRDKLAADVQAHIRWQVFQ